MNDLPFGGTTKGIRWSWTELEDRRLRLPHGSTMFAVYHDLEAEKRQEPFFVVVRVVGCTPVPPSPSMDWPGAHRRLEPALREAVARERVFLPFAIQALGAANAVASEGSAPTLFERRAYENRQNPRYLERKERGLH
jgi:hypothetical protein